MNLSKDCTVRSLSGRHLKIVGSVIISAVLLVSCGRASDLPNVALSSGDPSPSSDASVELPTEVPAVSDARQCDPGWLGFDNPALHVTFCYPQGWGFGEYGQKAPPETVKSGSLISLRLLSGEAFGRSYSPETEEIQDGLRRGIIDVSFAYIASPDYFEGGSGCVPDAAFGSRQGSVSCEARFDIGGMGKGSDQFSYTDSGEFIEFRLVSDLASPVVVTGVDGGFQSRPGAQLFVQVWSLAARFQESRAEVMTLLESIEPY